VVARAVLERALSWQQAELVTWVGLDKLALQDAAARLGISRNTATVRLREAVGRLAGWLDVEVPEGWRRRQRRTPAESPEPVLMRSP